MAGSIKKQRSQPSVARRVVCVSIAVVLVVAAWVGPTPEGLTVAGKMSLALMVSGIFLWVTEPCLLYTSRCV